MLRYPKTIAFAAGLASATGFAPLGLWPLTIAAFIVLIQLLADAGTGRRAAAIGWWFALGQFVLGLNWIATSFTYQAAMPAWLGWVAVVLLSLYLAVFPAVAAVAAWWAADRLNGEARRGLSLFLVAGWIATEYLRGTVFTGFAWNPVGAIWASSDLAALTARWIGTYGLSGFTVLLAAVLRAALLEARNAAPGPARVRAAYRAGLLVLLACVIGYPAPPGTASPTGPRLHIVQPNIGQQDKWRPDFAAQNFARLASLSGTPGKEPRLLFWPEAAVPDYLELEPEAAQRLGGLLGARDVMLTGGVSLVLGPDRQVAAARNSLFVVDAGGRILSRYDKAHLVPYGEYLPMRPILSAIGLSRLAPGDLDFIPGPGPRTLSLPGFGPSPLKVGIQICYEMVFPGHVVDRTDRPAFLFNPSNDAWFGRWGPPQHLAQARLRAIEEGLPIVRSTPTGISAVIDANGRLVDALPWQTAGSIAARLPEALPPTPFSRWGNWLSGLFGLMVLAGAIARARTSR